MSETVQSVLASLDSPEGLEGVSAGDVRVEDEERRVILAKDITSKGKGTGCGVRIDQRGSVTRTGTDAPVPSGSVSTLKVMLMPNSSSVFLSTETMTSGR